MMNQTQFNNTSKPLPPRQAAQQRHERGVQLVEVVLVMPVLIMLIAATAEFGRYFYTYSVLARATRISARYLSGNLLNNTEQTKAKNLAVCGSTTTCSTAVVPGLTTSNIQVTTAGGTTLLPATVTVSIVSYNYQSVFNLGNWVGGTWTTIAISPSTTMRYLLDD